MAFSILNTPRELGRRLLRRAAQRSTPSTSSGTRRSPRIATAKSPKGKVGTARAPGHA
ncbi:NUMA1 protein, partial [Alaudala cheleensis]|nr:NUMA1 protein [Alaudala cheleensis]